MDVLHQLINAIEHNWGTIAGFLTATGVLSLVVQKFKKWLSLESPKVVYLMTAFLGLSGVIIQAAITTGSATLGQLGTRGAFVLAALQFVYIYIIKPGTKLLEDAKVQREGKQTTTVTATQTVSPTETTKTLSTSINPAPVTSTTAARPTTFDA